MKHAIITFVLTAGAFAFGGDLACRWVFVDDVLTDDVKLARVTNAVELAAANGANGVLLGCGLDTWRNHPTWRHAYGDLPAWMKMMDEPCSREGVLK